MNLLSIRLPSAGLVQLNVSGLSSATYDTALVEHSYPGDFCGGSRLCIQDSGASGLFLPIPQEYCNVTWQPSNEDLDGGLLIDLEGIDGTPITLTFPFSFIFNEINDGWVKCTGLDGNFVLGFPVYGYYYLAHDMAGNTLTFVDLPQNSETSGTEPGRLFGVGAIAANLFALFYGLLSQN